LVDQLFNSSEKRLARILLLLAHFGKEGRPEKVIPKISQETLAEMVGTTRSRINFFMNRFRKLGFINYNGEFEIHSSLLNVVLHDSADVSAAAVPDGWWANLTLQNWGRVALFLGSNDEFRQKFSIIQALLAVVYSRKARWWPSGDGMAYVS
jgi:hypothetical protein